MNTLSQVLTDPKRWASLDAIMRQQARGEAMEAALRQIEIDASRDATASTAATCPVAERIIKANTREPLNMIDALFHALYSPESAKCDAAATIIRIRKNRAALGYPAPAMTAKLLERAGRSRRRVAALQRDGTTNAYPD